MLLVASFFVLLLISINEIILALVLMNFLILFNLYKRNNSFLVKLYILVFSVTLLFPALIQQIFNVEAPHFISNLIQTKALIYVFAYNLIFLFSIELFKKYFNTKPLFIVDYYSPEELDSTNKYYRIIGLLIGAFLLSLVAKYFLDINYLYTMVSSEERGKNIVFFIQFIKVFAKFDLVVLLILGFLIQTTKDKKSYYVLFFIILGITIYLTLLTGSRAQVIIIGILMIYVFNEFAYKYKFWILGVSFFVTPIFFAALAYYRVFNGMIGAKDFSLIDSVSLYISKNNIFNDILDILLGRLNYLDIVGKTIEILEHKVEYYFDYMYNIIALVPRFLWSEKPLIGLDMHKIGQELLIIGSFDDNSTAGLSIAGESFYQLGYYGVIVAIFHAFLIYFVNNKIQSKSLLGYVLYFLLSIYMISKDGLLAIVPGIIHMIIPIFLFITLFVWLTKGDSHQKSNN